MKRFGIIPIVLIGIASFPLSLESDEKEGWLIIEDGLKSIGMSREDLSLRLDYLPMDSFRLDIVNRLMKSPLDAIPITLEMAEKVPQKIDSLHILLKTATMYLDLPVGVGFDPRKSGDTPTFKEKVRAYSNTPLRDAIAVLTGSKEVKEIPDLPMPLQESVAHLLIAIKDGDNLRKEAFQRITEEERRFLKEFGRKPILEEEEEEAESDRISRRVLKIAEKVDFQRLFQGGIVIARALDEVVPQLREVKTFSPEWVFQKDTPYGKIVLGGEKDDVYNESHLLLIDFGGKDVYHEKGDAGLSMIIDLKGDDIYSNAEDFGQGGGFLGLSFLLDLQGDDLYTGKSFSQGCGFFGVGALVDQEGNDTYKGEVGVQGTGFFGVGILSDGKGIDTYESQFFSQGFGYVKGCGVLSDFEGNDRYTIGGRTPDFREPDYFACLGQGFGFGIRDIASGGVGILYDGKGNDNYIGEYFVQGSSYWFALGCLLDLEGNDNYIARRYSQGAATHLTIGILFDKKGNDNYLSWGVSQGCGHDLSLGLLYDKEGNDKYASDWLSQGAGNANGIGILFDEGGDDQYTARQGNNQGYGNLDRDYGSIGLLLDQGGKDVYTLHEDSQREGKDNSHWTKSHYGAGIDRESSP